MSSVIQRDYPNIAPSDWVWPCYASITWSIGQRLVYIKANENVSLKCTAPKMYWKVGDQEQRKPSEAYFTLSLSFKETLQKYRHGCHISCFEGVGRTYWFLVLNQLVSLNEKTVGQLRRWRWILHWGTRVAWSGWGGCRSKNSVLWVGSAPRQVQAAHSLWPCRNGGAVFRCREYEARVWTGRREQDGEDV